MHFWVIFSNLLKSQHDNCNQRVALLLEQFLLSSGCVSFGTVMSIRTFHCSNHFRSLYCVRWAQVFFFFPNSAWESQQQHLSNPLTAAPPQPWSPFNQTARLAEKTDDRSIYIFGEEPCRNGWKEKNADKDQQRGEKREEMKRDLETDRG